MLAGSLVYLFILHSLLPRTSVVCSSQISGSLGSSLTSSDVETRMPDLQSRELGFESPLLQFQSLGIFAITTTPQFT